MSKSAVVTNKACEPPLLTESENLITHPQNLIDVDNRHTTKRRGNCKGFSKVNLRHWDFTSFTYWKVKDKHP